ncbi:MAG: lysylphosphatidylglycerol synthase domain-containing protein, partial [Candidatus Micrarchaeota archaeon]
MDRKILLAINAIVSIALVAIVLHLVGFSEVLGELAGVDIGLLLISMLFLLGMDMVMVYRIRMVLEEAGARAPFMGTLRSHFMGMLFADFTPSRTGYFATAAALRYNQGVPGDKALLSIFGPQIFDFAFKVITGSLAILYIMMVFIGPEQGW